jgi:hypothetical protein
VARGHSDRSRREGCGTEVVLGSLLKLWIWALLVTAIFSGTAGRVLNN